MINPTKRGERKITIKVIIISSTRIDRPKVTMKINVPITAGNKSANTITKTISG